MLHWMQTTCAVKQGQITTLEVGCPPPVGTALLPQGLLNGGRGGPQSSAHLTSLFSTPVGTLELELEAAFSLSLGTSSTSIVSFCKKGTQQDQEASTPTSRRRPFGVRKKLWMERHHNAELLSVWATVTVVQTLCWQGRGAILSQLVAACCVSSRSRFRPGVLKDWVPLLWITAQARFPAGGPSKEALMACTSLPHSSAL